MLRNDGIGTTRATRVLVAVLVVLTWVLSISGHPQPQEDITPAPAGEEPPGAYVVSFRMVLIDIAEGYQPYQLAGIPEGRFFFAPEDADGFYDQARLAKTYGPEIDPGLVATVGPVYSMAMRPNSDPVEIFGVTGDGQRKWWVAAFVEPLSPDGRHVKLRSKWNMGEVVGFDAAGGDFGAGEHWLNIPLSAFSGSCFRSAAGDEPVGTQFGGAWVILVLIQKAVP